MLSQTTNSNTVTKYIQNKAYWQLAIFSSFFCKPKHLLWVFYRFAMDYVSMFDVIISTFWQYIYGVRLDESYIDFKYFNL